jgi:D-3-phosphoglycerate dehydrogenase
MSIKILANDGIEAIGKEMLEKAGFEVDTNKIPQEELATKLQNYAAICVRSATTVRKELIDSCPNLRAIARGGVGMDNIDVEYAKSRGIAVINTPAASSRSVAELAMAHLFGLVRFLHDSNRQMPQNGYSQFNDLKKAYAKGVELEEKTIGIVGIGRIGQEMASLALGAGMKVLAVDPFYNEVEIAVGPKSLGYRHTLNTVSLDQMLASADIISLHIPSVSAPILDKAAFGKMKKGMIILNASRGGTIDESALLDGLEDGTVSCAGLDVFENEPKPLTALLTHPKISLSPHIGASTIEAQNKIGIELAQKLIEVLS